MFWKKSDNFLVLKWANAGLFLYVVFLILQQINAKNEPRNHVTTRPGLTTYLTNR